MQTHILNKKAIAVTGLPDDATDIKIVDGTDLFYKSDMGGSFSKPHGFHHSMEVWGFPAGDWKVLGFAQSLKEEEWLPIVERSDRFPDHYLFHDYTSDSTRWAYLLKTAIEAGHSLLKSKGLYASNPYDTDPNLLNMYPEWQSAQLLTNPLILVIE